MSTDYSSIDFKKKFEELQELPPSITALARAAMTSVDVNDAGFLAFNSQSIALEKDGCDFLAAIYFYLVKLNCPGIACDYTAVVTCLSDGDSEKEFELTDEFLSGVMNVSTRTIRRKRATLIEWMRKENYSVLGITEGEYDHANKRNKPTKYRAILAPIAAKIVLGARSGKLWSTETKAQNKALEAAAEEEIWRTPEAPPPVKKRKKKKEKPPAKEVEQRRKTLLTNFKKSLRLVFKMGNDPRSFWTELRDEMEHVCEEDIKIMEDTGGVF